MEIVLAVPAITVLVLAVTAKIKWLEE